MDQYPSHSNNSLSNKVVDGKNINQNIFFDLLFGSICSVDVTEIYRDFRIIILIDIMVAPEEVRINQNYLKIFQIVFWIIYWL